MTCFECSSSDLIPCGTDRIWPTKDTYSPINASRIVIEKQQWWMVSTQVNAFLGSVAKSAVFTLLPRVKVISPPPLECDLDGENPWWRGKQQKKMWLGYFSLAIGLVLFADQATLFPGQYVYLGLFRQVCKYWIWVTFNKSLKSDFL